MNKKLEAVLVGLGVFTAAYLTGCFMEFDFNITHWDKATRFITGLIGLASLPIIVLTHYNFNRQD
jgi:hypothetical protein